MEVNIIREIEKIMHEKSGGNEPDMEKDFHEAARKVEIRLSELRDDCRRLKDKLERHSIRIEDLHSIKDALREVIR